MKRPIKSKFLELVSPVYHLDKELDSMTRESLNRIVNQGEDWLDLGCGLKPFLACFEGSSYVGLDVEVSGRNSELKEADITYDGVNIPFDRNTFDGILCTQVLEHVENVEYLLAECNRVLKLGGSLVVSVPFVYREHEQPFDFRRFTSFGILQLLEKNGFEVNLIQKCLTNIETVAMLLNCQIANGFNTKGKIHFLLGSFFIYLSSRIARLLNKRILDNGELYCCLVIDCRKTTIDEKF